MTAINALIRGQTAYIFTDGRLYTPTGDMMGISSQKVEIFGHMPAVLAAQGNTGMRSALAFHAAQRFRTFDEMVAGISDLLRATLQGLRASPAGFDLTLAGWSHQNESMELWSLTGADRPGIPAFEMHEIVAAVAPQDERLIRDIEAAGLDIENDEPEALGLALLRMQRDRVWPVASNGRMISGVGDFAQMTTVHRDRVETRVLERWDQAA